LAEVVSRPDLLACNASAPEAHCVDSKIEQTNGNGAEDQERWSYIWIDERIQVVQQKSALIRGDPSAAAEPIFHWGQRARPLQDFE
jgi:hypothetical protein